MIENSNCSCRVYGVCLSVIPHFMEKIKFFSPPYLSRLWNVWTVVLELLLNVLHLLLIVISDNFVLHFRIQMHTLGPEGKFDQCFIHETDKSNFYWIIFITFQSLVRFESCKWLIPSKSSLLRRTNGFYGNAFWKITVRVGGAVVLHCNCARNSRPNTFCHFKIRI